MSIHIELYRGPDRQFFGTIPFLPVVQESLERILGRDLGRASIKILVLNVPEDSPATGTPAVEHMTPEFGYTYVKVSEGGYLVYQHPHPLFDTVTQALQKLLRDQYPEETRWAFRLDIPGIPRSTAKRPAPEVAGGVMIRSYGPGEKPGFTIRRIAEEEPPVKTLADFGVTRGYQSGSVPVKALLHPSLQLDLQGERPFSHEVEEGGFLVGRVYRDGDQEGAYLLEITDAVAAEYTGASFLHFTFTGDSFAGVKRTLQRERPGERLLGWYHTHLFAATPEFGLSSIDLTLHFGTFTIPWQVAGLINISGNERTLRFYAPQGNDLILVPHWVIDERYEYGSNGH